MIYARINVNVDTGVYLFLHISCGTEYSQHSNALAHPNPSANSNKFKLLPYHCYANGFRTFRYFDERRCRNYLENTQKSCKNGLFGFLAAQKNRRSP